MTVAAVVTAAGSGTRLGAGQPKALVMVAGQQLVAWAVDRVASVASTVVVAAPADFVEETAQALALVGVGRPAVDIRVVPGGETRQESVAVGLAELLRIAHPDIVIVHDAARAFMPVEAMHAAIGAIEAGADGAVPVVPLVDTLVATPDDEGVLGAAVDRDGFRAAQTPQAFRAEALRDSHARAAADGLVDATDDASLVRRYGYRVVATEGHPWGFKVTSASDLALAEHVARQS